MTAEIDGPYAWRRLGITILAAIVANVGMWSVVVVLPAAQAEFGVARADASLPYVATMVGFAFGNLWLGRVVDRFGVSAMLAASALMLGAGYALAAMSGGLAGFAAAHGLLIGLGSAAGFGPLIADVSHWFRRRRGVAVSAAASGNYLAGALWPFAIEAAMAEAGWRGAYFMVAAVVVALLLPLALLLRRRPPIARAGGAAAAAAIPLKDIGLSPRALQALLAVAGVGCCVAMAMPQVHLVALCVDLGYGVTAGAEMLSLMLVAGVFSRMASGLLADRIGGVATLLLGSVLQCVALILYMPSEALTSLYVVSLLFGLSQGGIVPSYALVVREYMPAAEAGRRVGFVLMATIFGMAFGGWISGWIFDVTGSYRMAFLNGIGWNLLNVAIVGWLFWRSGGEARGKVATA